MGIGHQAGIVHIIDFGLAKEFRNPDTHLHIPLRQGRGLTGTPLFASNNSHLGYELGRRDDLESLAYILIYFLRGDLPWERLASSDLIARRKLECSIDDLCYGLPVEYATLLRYSRTLAFHAKPNYDYIIGLFRNMMPHGGAHNDAVFEWVSEKHLIRNHLYAPTTQPLLPISASRTRTPPTHKPPTCTPPPKPIRRMG
jgi:serine/threonine protein kinase